MRRSVLALTVAQLAGDEDRLLDAMRPAGQANASRASRQTDTRAAARLTYAATSKKTDALTEDTAYVNPR